MIINVGLFNERKKKRILLICISEVCRFIIFDSECR